MEDVLETYEKPYGPQEPVECLDEQPVTLHADVRPSSPATCHLAMQYPEAKTCRLGAPRTPKCWVAGLS